MAYNFFYTFLLVTILVLIIATILLYCIKHKKTLLTQKNVYHVNYHIDNIKMRSNNEFKEIDIKNQTCYYLMI